MFRLHRWAGAALAAFALCLLVALPQAISGGKSGVKIKVIVLEDDAKLWIDGKETKQRGTTRKFDIPGLEAGAEYVMTFKAQWDPNNYTKITRTKVVTFKPSGDEIVVDLRKADPKERDDVIVRYVPTPQEVVEEMLRMGKVGKGDVVWDIGCGDGRFVITAVKDFGAKSGKGFDIDPARVKESNENAKKAKVTDKVAFSEANALEIKSAEEASVVCLYMGEDLNAAMRPMLRKTMKPGSRVISHRFTMGDWKPNETRKIEVGGEQYVLHLWIITEKDNKEGK
ncbi:MAG: TIGR03000 domain-containing protein [Gemmataceae bacterium]